MCGIVGYVGADDAAGYLVDGLLRLEYRGYDSAGVSVITAEGGIDTVKSVGKISVLQRQLELRPVFGATGIGHTRWATHGAPTTANAHPHTSCNGRISLVHNGIIENFQALRTRLEAAGHRFLSQTDTEVVVHLIEEAYAGDPLAALRDAVGQVEGAYALAVVFADHPGCIYATRRDSPLAVCSTGDACMLASDAIPLVPYVSRVHYLMDGEIDVLRADGSIECLDAALAPVACAFDSIPFTAGDIDLGPYGEYMMKEIHEQPAVIQGLLSRYVRAGRVVFDEGELPGAVVRGFDHVTVVGCGTSYHAGLYAREIFEDWLGVRCDVEIASEYRYRRPVVDAATLVIALSQSGETADTLAAVRLARSRGAFVAAITNVPGSRITRESDATILLGAGAEISVAATKSFTAQLVLLSLIGLFLASERGTLGEGRLYSSSKKSTLRYA